MKREDIKWALVTGASSGIGESLSRLLADKNINIIINGRNAGRLQTLADELSGKVQVKTVIADLADPKQREHVVEAIRLHVPELIINNAGFGLYGDALSYETAEQMEILEVNGAALLQLTLEGARSLVNKGKKGVVLNVASAAAFPVFPTLAVYAASKAFVVSLSESLDVETNPYGVRVLVSCPGMVSTSFRQRAGGRPKEPSSNDGSMDVEFAAAQVWKQIENEKTVHIFNWTYRLMIFLVRYLLPKKWVAATVKANINKRRPPSPLINDPQGKK